MKRPVTQLLSVLLTICILLAAIPSALAASGQESGRLSAAAKAAGFDYTYEETYREITASASGGEAEAVIDAPAGLIADRGVYAAVLPLEGSDQNVTFTTVSGDGPYTVRFAEEGCASFGVMLVQPVIDGGGIAMSTSAEYLAGSGRYRITYTASLSMSDAMAELAVLNKSDPKMSELVFTCTLTDPLLSRQESVPAGGISFESSVFQLVSTQKTSGGWQGEFALVSGWNEGTAAEVKSRLQQPMTITCTADVGRQDLQDSLVNQKLYTSGILTITTQDAGAIPGLGSQSQITVPVNLAQVQIRTSGGSSSGDGGSASSTYPVETQGDENGSAVVSHTNAGAGTQVTVTVEADYGFRLNELQIVDSAGNLVPYVDNGDGTYTFTMPSGEVEVSSSFRRITLTPVETGVSTELETEDHIIFMYGDDQGNFRPNDNITRSEVAAIFHCLLRSRDIEAEPVFQDVPSDAWYAEAVNTMAALGAVGGVGGGRFEPERPITRAEFVTIAVSFANGLGTDVEQIFPDVSAGHWASGQIALAAYFGWITGDDQGSFRSDAYITRGEAATIVNRMLGRLSDRSVTSGDSALRFPDVEENYWGWHEILEATTAHDYTLNSDWTIETWYP